MANISRNSFNENALYDKVIQQQGMPFTDYDYNELQDIQRVKLRRIVQELLGDGILTGFQVGPTAPASLGVSVAAGTAYVNGYRVFSSSATTVNITPPASGSRTDAIYLDISEVEINSTQDPNIKSSQLSIEPTRRTKVQVTIGYTQGATTAPINTTTDSYYLLGTVTVNSTDTAINAGAITDKRVIKSNGASGTTYGISGNLSVGGTSSFTGAATFSGNVTFGNGVVVSGGTLSGATLQNNTLAAGFTLTNNGTIVGGNINGATIGKNGATQTTIDQPNMTGTWTGTPTFSGNMSFTGNPTFSGTPTFSGSTAFTAATASLKATQVILGQTNNVNAPKSTIYLASASATGVGMDASGNLIPISPASIGTGYYWDVRDKNDAPVLSAYIDGTKKVSTANNVIDDGNGNATFSNSVTIGSLKFANAQGIYTDIYGNFLTPSGVTAGSYWNFQDKAPTSVFKIWVDGTKKISTANNTLDNGSGGATFAGGVSAPTFTSTVAQGTAPFTVTSSTMVTNLNANYVNGYSFNQSLKTTDSPTFVNVTLTGGATISGTTATGAYNAAPTATATSSNNYGSNIIQFQSSTWNGTSAVTNGRNLWMDKSNLIQFGNLSGSGVVSIDNSGVVSGSQFQSNVATGTAPFTVASTTKVANLNADMVDGYNTSTTAVAGTIPVYNASAQLVGDITGKAQALATSRTLSWSGDISGSLTFDGSANATATMTLPNVVTAGTYTKVTVNAKGLVTGSSSLTSSDVTSALTFTPLKNTGDTISGQLTSSVAQGTAPFVVTSTTVNTNFNADMVDGYHMNQSLKTTDSVTFGGLSLSGSFNLTNNQYILPKGTATSSGSYSSFGLQLQNSVWNGSSAVTNGRTVWMDTSNNVLITNVAGSSVVSFDNNGGVSAQTFSSGIATGTAPFTVSSTTMVSNLNAQYVGGVQLSGLVQTSRNVSTGSGLTGGGDLSADRTLSVSFGGNGTATTVAHSDHSHTIAGASITDVTITSAASGQFLQYNGSVWVNHTLAAADIPSLDWSKIGSGKPTSLSGYGITDAVSNTVSVSAGTGLSGGGTLTTSQTLSVAFGGTGSSTSVARSDHNHDSTYAKLSGATFTGSLYMDSISNGASQWSQPVYFNTTNASSVKTTNNYLQVNTTNDLIYTKAGTGNTIWHSGNDGSGSGLDADSVDGIQGSSIVQTSRNITTSSNSGLTGGGALSADLSLAVSFAGTGSATSVARSDHNHDTSYLKLSGGTLTGNLTAPAFVSTVATGTAPFTVSSTTMVSNLNANYLAGMGPSSTNTASSIVQRDSSGNFSAGTITATLSGNASSASSVPWSGVSSKPTSVSGYGITDAVTTGRQVLAGSGLTGGGALSADQTLSVSFGGSGSATTVSRSDHNHSGTYVNTGGDTMTGTLTVPSINVTASNGGIPVEAWSNLPLNNSWVNYGTGSWGTAQFYKDKMNHVFVKGIIKSGTSTAGTTVATLPPLYRPAQLKYAIGVDGNLAMKRIQIGTDGTISIPDGCSNSFLVLDTIQFLAEQ